MRVLSLLSISIVLTLVGCGADGNHTSTGVRVGAQFYPITCGAQNDGHYTYTPDCLRQAYQITPELGDGTGQTVAIIDDFGNPNLESDLSSFSQKFNLPPANLKIAYPNGEPVWSDPLCHYNSPQNGNQPNVCAGWAGEVSLDVQMVHVIAPGANILVVIAGPGTDATRNDLQNDLSAIDYAVAQGASVVSMSWEFRNSQTIFTNDSHFQKTGVTFIASAGDSPGDVAWPSMSPYVLSVGGTSLQFDPTSEDRSESAWASTGGGIDSFVSLPDFQNGLGGTASTSYRSGPDVSMVADAATGVFVYDSMTGPFYNGDTDPWVNGLPPAVPDAYNWEVAGGTSVGAPVWAGLIALANAKRPSGSPLGDIHQALYQQNAGAFLDITSGCLTNSQSSTGCASEGFDLLTGLGSPIASKLVPYLVSLK